MLNSNEKKAIKHSVKKGAKGGQKVGSFVGPFVGGVAGSFAGKLIGGCIAEEVNADGFGEIGISAGFSAVGGGIGRAVGNVGKPINKKSGYLLGGLIFGGAQTTKIYAKKGYKLTYAVGKKSCSGAKSVTKSHFFHHKQNDEKLEKSIISSKPTSKCNVKLNI